MKYLDSVNIRQGTKSVPRFSNGNTLPMTQLPFGMGGFAVQTASDKGSWFFHPEDRCLEGVRLTHQPSPWIGDYGCVVFMPQEGEPYAHPGNRWSGYRPAEAVMRPDHMKLDFLRYNALFELAPTLRGAAIRISYNGKLVPRFAVMPAFGYVSVRLDAANRRIIGHTTAQTGNYAKDFKLHFVFQFDCELDADNTYATNAGGECKKGTAAEGEGAGLNAALKADRVNIKIASSYISEEQALVTLERELGGKSFEQVRLAAENEWELRLSSVVADCHDEEQKKTFYTCLARMFLYPHMNYEVDRDGKEVHYTPHNGGTAPGKSFTNNGFWDTFRTVYPFFSIVAPDVYATLVEGFVNIYRDSGWLPRWPAAGEVGCMPGTFIDAVVADAAVKGIISGEVLRTAFEGMLKHSRVKSENGVNGRIGVEEYNKYGYVPRSVHESVNNSLDSHYGDFCIAQVAKVLGEDKIYEEYMARSMKYKVLFDKETGFMRGRDENGNMKPDFDPLDWGGEYTEGSAYQTSFAVHHDFDGLAQLYGGKDEIIKKLDEVFATPPKYNKGGYGAEIHEMTEMAAIDFGQCAISNQPSFHIPYLFAYYGAPEKTEYWVERLAREAFSYKDDGFPGDEDNGTTAGWYVLSSMGLYSVCPGRDEYVKGKKLVKSVRVNGKELDVDRFEGGIIKHSELFS